MFKVRCELISFEADEEKFPCHFKYKIGDEILDRFTDFERNDIGPVLTPVLLEVMLEALTDMKYIEARENGLYATGREPPSRPKIG